MRQEILKILGGHSASRVLMVANELGIFDLLSDRSMSAGDLANKMGTNPKATERLCNALAAMSLLSKGQNRFRLPTKLKPLLTKTGKASLTNSISLSHEFWRFWTDLGAFIRSDRPLTEMLTLIQKDPVMLEQFIHAMRDRAVLAARERRKCWDVTSFPAMSYHISRL